MYDAHIKAWKQDNRIARREALARYSAKVQAAHKAAPVAESGEILSPRAEERAERRAMGFER
jgi:hypothetical protein